MSTTIDKKIGIKNLWKIVREYDAKDFELVLTNLPYKSDYINGMIDTTLLNKNILLDTNLDSNRDCDDFAYLWFEWARYKNVDAYMIACMTKGAKSSHMVTILKLKKSYLLLNYSIMGIHDSIVDCIESLSSSKNKSKKIYYMIYKTHRRKKWKEKFQLNY